MQILQLDTAWRQRVQKEGVAHLAHTAQTRQTEQHSLEQCLRNKERTAAKQVSPCHPYNTVQKSVCLQAS